MHDCNIGDRASLQGHPVTVRAIYGRDVLVQDEDGGYISHTTMDCLLPPPAGQKNVVRLSPVYSSDDIDTPEKLWRWATEHLPDPKRMPEFAADPEAMWEEMNVLKFIVGCIDDAIYKGAPNGGE